MSQLCWLRRDLRLHDHHALAIATQKGPTYICFNFDPHILKNLPQDDRRMTFIFESLAELGDQLIITHGDPLVEIPRLIEKLNITHLYFNRDYEPYAKSRDEKMAKILVKKGIQISHFKDHVFYEKHEVLTEKRELYKVFTPYKNKWLSLLQQKEFAIGHYEVQLKNIISPPSKISVSNPPFILTQNGQKGGTHAGQKALQHFAKHIQHYHEMRDFPALEKTSSLGPYLRMGNISIRDALRLATSSSIDQKGHQSWLNELIWRDFYQAILDVYPRVQNSAFKTEYEHLQFENNAHHFELWKEGKTGFPLVDAAMRCLNSTGSMHNRLRMVVASFLTKTLLIDWKWGEKYFALKLLDFDLAANNGGWQWCASTGVDAQPYFRIFNPYTQSQKFDPEGIFIKTWVPELACFKGKDIHCPSDTSPRDQALAKCQIGKDYPHPIVAYKSQREKALTIYSR